LWYSYLRYCWLNTFSNVINPKEYLRLGYLSIVALNIGVALLFFSSIFWLNQSSFNGTIVNYLLNVIYQHTSTIFLGTFRLYYISFAKCQNVQVLDNVVLLLSIYTKKCKMHSVFNLYIVINALVSFITNRNIIFIRRKIFIRTLNISFHFILIGTLAYIRVGYFNLYMRKIVCFHMLFTLSAYFILFILWFRSSIFNHLIFINYLCYTYSVIYKKK